MSERISMQRRLARHYVVDEATGCWLWTKALTQKGYGKFRVARIPGDWTQGNRTVRAHRVSYEAHVGPIPEGLTLDHLCRVRHCVNPAHLEPVTIQENIRRGEGMPARNARKTECKNGHAFDESNTFHYTYRGHRRRACRICRRAADTRCRARAVRLSGLGDDLRLKALAERDSA